MKINVRKVKLVSNYDAEATRNARRYDVTSISCLAPNVTVAGSEC